MRFTILSTLLVALLSAPAFAWNSTGHMVVAQLAWQRLTPQQRQAAVAILKEHPHYAEYLIADRPDSVPEDQWAFWRAATWPDWIREHERPFSHPDWHYIDFPFVPPGSSEIAANHMPRSENILTALPVCFDKARSAQGQDRAISLCWLLHLIGDIHQPLHCAALYTEQLPKGDEGGNKSLYRLEQKRVIKLHPFWDDLIGKSAKPSAIKSGAEKAQQALDANRAEVTREEIANPSFEAWAKESYALAVRYAYADGKVIPAVGSDRKSAPADVPDTPAGYAEQAGLVAHVAVAKAGERLAGVLGQVLR